MKTADYLNTITTLRAAYTESFISVLRPRLGLTGANKTSVQKPAPKIRDITHVCSAKSDFDHMKTKLLLNTSHSVMTGRMHRLKLQACKEILLLL